MRLTSVSAPLAFIRLKRYRQIPPAAATATTRTATIYRCERRYGMPPERVSRDCNIAGIEGKLFPITASTVNWIIFGLTRSISDTSAAKRIARAKYLLLPCRKNITRLTLSGYARFLPFVVVWTSL